MIFSKYMKKILVTTTSFVIGTLMCVTNIYGGEVLSQKSIEAFSDTVFKENMEKYKIPGAVITVVKGDKIILSKGYGYADLQNKNMVIPNETMFRIASVTKLFTATAAMQLVDYGKLDLEKPVNEYIRGFELPEDYKTPITLKHLLTHTSGLDDTVIGDLAKKPSDVKSLTEFYAAYDWKSVREPGIAIQYNNRGMGVVGAIIEQISQTDCKTYMQKHIFNPLQMKHTSFEMENQKLSKGYTYDRFSDKIKEEKMEGYFNVYPVGGILSTGEDMGHFMIAQLNKGIYNKGVLMTPKALDKMQERQVGFSDKLPGNTYGFHELYSNNIRIIEHSGYAPDGFLTELALIPKEKLGIFIAVNQGSNNTFPQDYITLFLKQYFSQTNIPQIHNTVVENTSKEVIGRYRSIDYSQTDLCKGDLIGAGKEVLVAANPDRSITITEMLPNYMDEQSHVTSWKGIEIEPYVYRNIQKDDYIAFKKDNSNKVSYMSKSSDSSMAAYEKIKWYDSNRFQMCLFITLLGVSLVEVLIWLGDLCMQGIKHFLKKPKVSRNTKLGQNLAGSIALFNLGFYIISMYTWGSKMHYGVPIDVKLDLIMILIATILTPVLGIVSIVYWENKGGKLGVKVNISLMTVIGFIFMWFNHYWNFIGFKF